MYRDNNAMDDEAMESSTSNGIIRNKNRNSEERRVSFEEGWIAEHDVQENWDFSSRYRSKKYQEKWPAKPKLRRRLTIIDKMETAEILGTEVKLSRAERQLCDEVRVSQKAAEIKAMKFHIALNRAEMGRRHSEYQRSIDSLDLPEINTGFEIARSVSEQDSQIPRFPPLRVDESGSETYSETRISFAVPQNGLTTTSENSTTTTASQIVIPSPEGNTFSLRMEGGGGGGSRLQKLMRSTDTSYTIRYRTNSLNLNSNCPLQQ